MTSEHVTSLKRGDGRVRLLDAAMAVIRTRGYADTTVDELCRAAGVTKGAFFHHFRSKEDLAVAAAGHFGGMARGLFDAAPFRSLPEPAARVLGYVDLRRAMLAGPIPEFTCLLGTLVQETYATHPAIRDAAAGEILGHAATLEADIAAAMAARGGESDFTAASLARTIQATLQGAFIMAKATGDPEAAVEPIDHLRRYLVLTLAPTLPD